MSVEDGACHLTRGTFTICGSTAGSQHRKLSRIREARAPRRSRCRTPRQSDEMYRCCKLTVPGVHCGSALVQLLASSHHHQVSPWTR